MNPPPEDPTSLEDPNLAPDHDAVYSRYAELHPLDEDPRDSVSRLLRETSLIRVEQYLDRLAEAFGQLPNAVAPNFRDSTWNYFLFEQAYSPRYFPKYWLIDDTLNEKLVRLAFFHKYPRWATAEHPISQAKMLEALAAASLAVGEELLNPSPFEIPDPEHVSALKQGYNHKYLREDTIVEPILKCLSDYSKKWGSTIYLAPYTALIGSSMIGKTRLLMQLSKTICVVYVCLRPPSSSGLPPRSVLADEMQLANKKVPELLVHYYRLLAAIFDVVAEFFSGQTGDHDEKQRLSEWHDYNFQSGGDLATRVRDTMKQFGQEESEASKAFQEKLEKLEFSTRFISNPELKVMLAFDEARALIALESNDDQKLSYFGALRRILSKIPPNMKVFTVFTDTTSHVSNFCPTLCNDSSARPPPDSLELYPPIYAIGTFDSKVPPSRPKTWNDLLSPPRLFSYGIPFFRIYVDTVKEPPNSLTSEVIVANVSKMAIGKLLCIPLRLDALTEGQKFALLGCTIQPQIHEASKLNSELVSSHMAQCLYISPTRERFISEYPSQFTLSMAANNFLAEHDSRLIACIKALTSVMQQGLISSGNSGELVSRIILLRAMQKAMLNSPIRTKQTHIPYGCSVRLEDFLRALTEKEEPTENRRTARKKPLKLNMNDAHQARLLKEGRIFWNHFIQISYTPQPADFLRFLYRGHAVQCMPNQKGFDQMFTIYLAPESSESTLTKDRISFCGVQAKNGSFTFNEEGPKWDSQFAGVGLEDSIPYLIICFSFKTIRTDYTLPQIPQRGSLIFHGLDNFGCLTPEIIVALKELLLAEPDVRQYHKDNELITRFVETSRPNFYPVGELSDSDEGMVDPDDQTS
ncbi:hypothetical protein H4Q26_013179 [Puccinia striiformis f. sp. tritici PST-130]|uniref:Uncharacterized protein n=1 Tax=Puccinia striiformis f. sp. tritici PST-78 TaxID=1165861 RepID=A0A0L0W1M4_9BASI|nr:hypothetical protein H4Q26_013179 [Puccinia striiformis f. sp. tritici PST-130]KNF05443.1 hypothetical protein PSTG_01252 [Puccinia striiformis f. sp. tritici PST-78]